MSHRLAGAVFVVSVLVTSACSGGGGTPSAPSPTAVSISITSSGTHLFLGLTETFTATLTLSNGSTQPLTGGTWGTDAAGVATVGSTTGLVTSVGPGEVTVFVDAQGIRGSKRITVVPNYQGIWSGGYAINSCTETGDFVLIDLCALLTESGLPLPVTFNLTQTASAVSGQVVLGTSNPAAFSTTAATNGRLTFQATTIADTVRVAQAWSVGITQVGRIDGTVVQTWTEATLSGQMVLAGTLQNMVKVSASAGPDGTTTRSTARSIREIAEAIRTSRR